MIIQPSNSNRQQPLGATASGTSAWQGGQNLPYLPNPSAFVSEGSFYQTSYPLQFTLFSGVSGVTTGQSDPFAEVNVLGRNYHVIAVTSVGTYEATVLIEGTLDGVNWFPIDSVTEVGGALQINGLFQSIRASIQAWTSGAITVTMITQRS